MKIESAVGDVDDDFHGMPAAIDGGELERVMTTTVKVLIEGNKACEVKVLDEGVAAEAQTRTIKPGSFDTVYIHGDQLLTVKEVGDFIE